MTLDPYLVLSRYLLSLFDAKKLTELRELQELENDASSGGQTAFFPVLAGRLTNPDLPLASYDARIAEYEERLRTARSEFNSFKYFQYLSLLFTEVLLDRMTTDPDALLEELNGFLNAGRESGSLDWRLEPFTLPDLRKLAFYLATGSGKTLLLHVHYWQVLHYLETSARPGAIAPKGEFGRILLLAPNPGLASQHLDELRKSGINAMLLSDVKNRLSDPMVFRDTVLVTDMFKLRKERPKNPGEAETVYYPDLGDRNLVFVDEGHKGTGGIDSLWRTIREDLTRDGLLFEYSATFAQVLGSEALKRNYGKRITFDYQYRYFYWDGYGKDFTPLNIQPSSVTATEEERVMLMGGLLLYYQQLRAFDADKLAPYNVEKPLWIFVGHTVTKKKGDDESLAEDTTTLTDVEKVVGFLQFFLEHPAEAEALAWRVLTNSELIGAANPFESKLEVVRDGHADAGTLYGRLAEVVFGGRGALEVRTFGEKASGEIGLKSTGSERYFGLVNIGDTPAFTTRLHNDLGIDVGSDPLRASLFKRIDEPNTSLNLLIGSRKFIEGWSSFRVSTMSLLYLGRGEGPQIIQLFGRGVRLRGKNRTLRRSADEPGAPPALKQLETLYVLGLKADYMNKFLEAIQQEESDLETVVLPIEHATPTPPVRLPVPQVPELEKFDAAFRSRTYALTATSEYRPTVDLAPKLFERDGTSMRLLSQGEELRLEPRHLDLLDWPQLMRKLEAYRRAQRLTHIHLEQDVLRRLLVSGYYRLIANRSQFEDVVFVQQAGLEILKRYLDRFHRIQLNNAQSEATVVGHLDYEALPQTYSISLDAEHVLLEQLRQLAGSADEWKKQDDTPIPRLYVAPELFSVVYQPLVYEKREGLGEVRVSPVPLNDSEVHFINDLTAYWEEHHGEHEGVELYLMRNASRGALGFHQQTGFYPDFVLWVKRDGAWRVVFLEPHGMFMEEDIQDNAKLNVFTKFLPVLNAKPAFKSRNVELDGFVISATDAPDVRGLERYMAGSNDWSKLARERRLLVKEAGRDSNMRHILAV